jgi:hypothetical protein
MTIVCGQRMDRAGEAAGCSLENFFDFNPAMFVIGTKSLNRIQTSTEP